MGKNNNNTHLAGEYFVAAELSRRGYQIGITVGNAKAIDMFAEYNEKTANIQVKAIKDRKSISFTITNKSKIKDNVIYIFVNLNGKDQEPDYYICYPEEVREDFKQYKRRGIVKLSSLKSRNCLRAWYKINEYLK